MSDVVDVVVIGGGPGGYTAALECARHGLQTVLVEAGAVGGTCLNVGCIPSKAIIHVADRFGDLSDLAHVGIAAAGSVDMAAAMRWKDDVVGRLRHGVESLLSRAGVRVVFGTARIVDGKTVSIGEETIAARNLVLATGSRPLELLDLPFGGNVVSSTEALSLTEIPRRLAVVGAGYIGLELGTAFAKLGSRVTVFETAAQILPSFDAALVRPVATRLRELGVDVRVDTPFARDGAADADVVLVAVGRVPVLDGWGVESLDLSMNGKFLAIDSRCRTSMRGVYAIGDVTGEPMLAHRAVAQATVAADAIAGGQRSYDHHATPAVCFTDPELFSVGLSPDAARAVGVAVVIGIEPFSANGRSLTLARNDGFVRVVGDAVTGRVVGVQAVGAGVSELASAAATAIELEATLGDLDLTMHAHPTVGESIHGAARSALDRLRRASLEVSLLQRAGPGE